ncbi:MAG: bifunctional phosphopantothenoylcysteine decarboxylase/phosphopantothenate--cysteine ligase CoaBC [Caldimicrobium sp.]
MLSKRRILLGICGGVALYKACEVIRLLKKEGAEVKVVLSTGAEKFASPLLFSALTGEKTYINDDFFEFSGAIPHIELARWPDLILILPATASFLSKLRCGQASELLLALLLATKAPVYLFPSMNTAMLEHPATQENIKILCSYGYLVYEPAKGELACGERGKGRLPEPEEILELVKAHFKPKDLLGKKILITGGPTREYLDQVRFITNASSGKTALFLLKEAYYRGGEIYFIWGGGQLNLLLPRLDYTHNIPYPRIITVSTTEEMLERAKEIFPEVNIAIFAAAPCDFRPKKIYPGKIKKKEEMELSLELTPDIAKTLSTLKSHQLTVGFALEEREKLSSYARTKKKEKAFDWLIANPIETIGADISDYFILGPDFEREYKGISKEELAKKLFDLILEIS